MSAHVICITSGGGLPVFSRKKGSCENLPFSTIGSLNGVHMFGKPLNIELLNTLTNDYSVAWKEFRESLVIIGIASGCSIEVLYQLLQLVFDAIVLIIGIDEIKNQRNIDRIKRELRVVLDSFAESVDSMYSCLLIGGKIAVATESYWSLNPHELRLLSLLAVAETNEKSKDVPVFLPYKSSTVAFRFVACSIMPDIQVCCLCGSTPSLKDIEYSAAQCFKNSMDILKSAEQVSPRHFPNSFVIDGGILGLLLINITLKKYMMSKNPQPNSSRKTTSSSHRLDILRTFFYQSVMKFLIPKLEIETNLIPSDKSSLDDQNEGIESYWCSEYHKCHAIRVNDNILCVLYNSSTPTHAMRLITKKTLSLLISDKQTCW
ncbi:protein fuzzy homolog isoform X2 [Cylas formicarius]|uniref:protein fuzzy homolog isoform X2 n=1 Tax=Cylas formicarius TaxID=197179 RepID=UPI0029585FFB|nr:protein fuzzy homolog isoform X2 [Cylas formicarius]